MKIHRESLVKRHNPVLEKADPYSPLSVGNGDLAYTADCTGFQNYQANNPGTTPLCTMTQWGFHSYPESINREDNYKRLKLTEYNVGNRKIGYMKNSEGQEELYNTLRESPHRLNLVRICLLEKTDSKSNEYKIIDMTKLTSVHQKLDLWTGELKSSFIYNEEKVNSSVVCNPNSDVISMKISSPLIESNNLFVAIEFPYGSHEISGSNWDSYEKHKTELTYLIDDDNYKFKRTLDNTEYFSLLKSNGSSIEKLSSHLYVLKNSKQELKLSLGFFKNEKAEPLLDFNGILSLSCEFWKKFWNESAEIQLFKSKDPRALELERRIILSRYLTAIQCSGTLPPQETGLTCNSWYGKFHLEMHPIHALHFPLWNNSNLLKKSLSYYKSIRKNAIELAKSQGYEGLRWPKMTDPEGYDSPSPVGTLLCWQQPHFIHFCEMLRLTGDGDQIIHEYSEIVFESAEFMADYVQYNKSTNTFDLAPPLIPAQENHKPEDTINPTFELEYWHWGLSIAINWKKILNQPIPEHWEKVKSNLTSSSKDIENKHYLAHEKCEDTYGEYAKDHPSFLMSLGFLPGERINKDIMSASLDKVIKSWDFNSSWGWDFPIMAMTAARLGRNKESVNLLLMDAAKNSYRQNGHNAQIPKTALPLYLPGNGSLLLAIALMVKLDSFPKDGTWTVECEGFKEYPF